MLGLGSGELVTQMGMSVGALGRGRLVGVGAQSSQGDS